MVDVICDTNFLIHLATKRIKNIDTIITEIGQIQFVVPVVVWNELVELQHQGNYWTRGGGIKRENALKTLNFAKKLKTIPMSGKYADAAIVEHVKKHGGIVGTMDRELKSKIKHSGGSVMSFSNDKIVLES